MVVVDSKVGKCQLATGVGNRSLAWLQFGK